MFVFIHQNKSLTQIITSFPMGSQCWSSPDCLFSCFFYLKDFESFTQCTFVCKYFSRVLQNGRCWESLYRRYNPNVSEELVSKYQGDFRALFLSMLHSLGQPIKIRRFSDKLIRLVEDYCSSIIKQDLLFKQISQTLARGVDPSFPGTYGSPIRNAVNCIHGLQPKDSPYDHWVKKLLPLLHLLLQYGADPIPFLYLLSSRPADDPLYEVLRSPKAISNHENPPDGSIAVGWRALRTRTLPDL